VGEPTGESKFNDLTHDGLGNWIKPTCSAQPARVFAIPFHVPNNAYFGQISRAAGLTLDRARIVSLAEKVENAHEVRKSAPDNYAGLLKLVLDAPPVERRAPGRRRRTKAE